MTAEIRREEWRVVCGLCCSAYVAIACAEAQRLGREFTAMPELRTTGLWVIFHHEQSWALAVVDSDTPGDHVSVGEWALPDAVGMSLRIPVIPNADSD